MKVGGGGGIDVCKCDSSSVRNTNKWTFILELCMLHVIGHRGLTGFCEIDSR